MSDTGYQPRRAPGGARATYRRRTRRVKRPAAGRGAEAEPLARLVVGGEVAAVFALVRLALLDQLLVGPQCIGRKDDTAHRRGLLARRGFSVNAVVFGHARSSSIVVGSGQYRKCAATPSAKDGVRR